MIKKDNLQNIISEVVSIENKKEKKIAEKVQLVVFSLDSEEYAVDIKELKEVIKVPVITPLPNSPSFVKGILNLRGKIVVALDLEKRFNLVREDNKQAKHIIVVQNQDTDFGILVDQVKEVIWVDKDSIQKTPELATSKIKADYLQGVVVINQAEKSRLLVLLNIKKMLDDKDLTTLSNTISEVVDSNK